MDSIIPCPKDSTACGMVAGSPAGLVFLLSPVSGECFKGFMLVCILKLLILKCKTRGYIFSWHKSAWLHGDKLIYAG